MISGVTDIIQEWRVCLKLSMEFRFIKILSMDKRFAEKKSYLKWLLMFF